MRESAVDIDRAAAEQLSKLGIFRRGRSRVWIDDHGWWIISAEFQPSAAKGRCYLNVGFQHLWIERDHVVFEVPIRPLGPSATIDVTDSTAVHQLVELAGRTIVELREIHGEGRHALQRLASSGGDDMNAGIAAALLGDSDTARRRLNGTIHESERGIATGYLDGVERGAVGDHARLAVETTRANLRLPPRAIGWDA